MSPSVRSRALVALVAVVVALLAVLAPSPAPAGPTAGYPDPPGPPEVGAEAAGQEIGGQNEDANWVPFLGDHEIWCTQRNPGYSGCATHHGYPAIDIGMPTGTRVNASGPGRVIAAGSSGDARGIYVTIEHTDGMESRYYHLSATRVRVGQRVERGTLIGLSGGTGRATSPHLHYEERTASGAQKDPGIMYGIVDGRLVAYPTARGYQSWNRTPYGTRLRNQAFAVDNTTLYWGGPGVASGDVDGDGVDDVVVGAPGEDVGVHLDAGEVTVLRGTTEGVTTAGAERVVQGQNGVKGTAASNEVSGAAVATGDFDADGYADVAIGAPAATVGTRRAAGEVIVVYGSPTGLFPAPRSQWLTSDRIGATRVVSESGDQFGAALASGDFDGDGFDDLVVGAPGEGLGTAPVAGAVTVFPGSATGLVRAAGRELRADSALAGDAEAGDRLGVALAAGDVNGDEIDDLAVGIPGEDTVDGVGRGENDAGAVLVVLGRPATDAAPGLRPAGSRELTMDTAGVAGDGKAGDQLGMSLAVGDLDGDGFAEVVAGAVGKDVGAARDAGSILVLRGDPAGVRVTGSRHLHADSPDVPGVAERGDRMGSGLALADVNGDGGVEIVVGVAGEDVGVNGSTATDAGAVLVLLGVVAPTEGIGTAGGRERHAGTATNGLADVAESSDVLGASVATGDINGDDVADLVLGAPGEDLPGARDGGLALTVDGTAGGPITGASFVFHGDVAGMAGDAERGDRWGGLFPIYLR